MRLRVPTVVAALVVAGILLSGGTASAAPLLYDGSQGCVRPNVAKTYPLLAHDAHFRIYGPSKGYRKLAQSDLGFFAKAHVWATYQAGLKTHPPAPLTVYETPPASAQDWDGQYGRQLCGAKSKKRVLLVRLSVRIGAYRNNVLAHELFHGFQPGGDDGDAADGIWEEATAEWAATLFTGNAGYDHTPSLDRAFLGEPGTSLDVDTPAQRKYGAGRFVMSLQRQLGLDPLWSLLRASFATPASWTTGLLGFLRSALPGYGTSLPKAEATFWSEHQGPLPRERPAAKATTTTFSGVGSTPLPFVVAHDAAKLVELTPGASAPKKVTVTLPDPPADAFFLTKVGAAASTVSSGPAVLVFCLSGSEPGAQPWPSAGLALGLVNGTTAQTSQTVTITTSSEDEDCDDLAPPITTLPVGCPGPPPDVNLGGYPYRSFSGRFLRVLNDWIGWQSLAVIKYGVLPTSAKPLAKLMRCAATRADAIRGSAPDPEAASYVHAWANGMRTSATKLAAGDVDGYLAAGSKASDASGALLAYTEKKDAQQDGLAP